MVRLDINEIEEEAYDQNNNINVWAELTMDAACDLLAELRRAPDRE